MSQDREFEKYIQGNSDLSQLYADLPQVKPPDHLDAAILAEAHRAVGSRPGAKPRRRWVIPLSMVATLFLVVMVGFQFPYLMKDAALTQAPKEEKAVVAVQEQDMAVQSRAPEPKALKAEAAAPRREREPVVASKPSPVAGNKPAAAMPEMQTAPAAADKRMRTDAPAELGNEMAFPKESTSSGGAEGYASDRLEQPRAAAVAVPAPAPAGAAIPEPVQAKRAGKELLKDESGDASLRPEAWLTRIKRLKQEGKLDEAKKELADFKKRYPDYPVPAALEIR